MDLKARLTALVSKQVTVWLVGGGVECSGTLASVGDDCIDVDNGPDAARWLIPVAAISCVAHRA